MPEAFIGIGSNIHPAAHLSRALAELRARYPDMSASPVYRNPPCGFSGDDFLNMVVVVGTRAPLRDLLAELRQIERRAGRQRGEARYGPRTLDLDLLLFGDVVSEDPQLPRPDVLGHAFVLKPLADLAGQRRHPLTGRTFAWHWEQFDGDRDQLTRVELPEPRSSRQSNSLNALK